MRGGARRGLLGLAGVAVIGYAGICGWMWHKQDDLTYPGGTTAILPLPAPESVGLAGFQAITLDTPDAEHLKGWWHPPASGRGVVLYLHGNVGNAGQPSRVERLRDIAAAGLGALAVEYRGFGGSSGHPSEAGLIVDAETAYDFITRQAPGAHVIPFGESLGTGVAVALAAERPVAGIMLDSPFASALRLARIGYPWLPTDWLLRNRWMSDQRITRVKAPLLVAQCDADKKIPPAEGQRLFALAPQPKEIIVLPGCGHIQIWTDAVKTKALGDFARWTTP